MENASLPQRKEKVLIIDDDNMSRMVITKTVQSLGLDSISFNDGRQAIEYLSDPERKNQITCVISDLMMLGSDGIDVLAYVRSQEKFHDTPFIFLTGAEFEVFQNLLRPYNYQAFIKKPIIPSELIQELQKYTRYKIAA